MTTNRRVTVIPGDGIGPEVVGATQRALDALGAGITWERCEAGAVSFRRGLATGVPAETLASIRDTRVVLKGPLETPVGYGEKSANVTLRKLFETYANVRPVRELPGVPSPFAGRGIDLVVVRENVEDLYAGIEHQQTPTVAQCLKLISRQGCEKTARVAFELARAEGRRRVTCATKANIMKLTEGLMKRTFEEVAREYPDIQADHVLVDNCAHQLVRAPEQFEVIVTTNMNGDILSDLTSGLIGGLGFAPGANLGRDVAMFEAVHGSAPTIAGQNIANPTAVMPSGAMLLRHLGLLAHASTLEHALAATLEDGIFTRDVAAKGAVGTAEFTDAVIARFGRRAERLRARDHRPLVLPTEAPAPPAALHTPMALVGADVFVRATDMPDALADALVKATEGSPFRLKMISNRGTQVWPSPGALPDLVDHHRCRFVRRDNAATPDDRDVLDLLARVGAARPWMHVEKLHTVDGAPAYTRAQGED